MFTYYHKLLYCRHKNSTNKYYLIFSQIIVFIQHHLYVKSSKSKHGLPRLTIRLNEARSWAPPSFDQPYKNHNQPQLASPSIT